MKKEEAEKLEKIVEQLRVMSPRELTVHSKRLADEISELIGDKLEEEKQKEE